MGANKQYSLKKSCASLINVCTKEQCNFFRPCSSSLILERSRNTGSRLFVNFVSLFMQKAKAISVIGVSKMIDFFFSVEAHHLLFSWFMLMMIINSIIWWLLTFEINCWRFHDCDSQLFGHAFRAVICSRQPVSILAGFYRENSHLPKGKQWLKLCNHS